MQGHCAPCLRCLCNLQGGEWPSRALPARCRSSLPVPFASRTIRGLSVVRRTACLCSMPSCHALPRRAPRWPTLPPLYRPAHIATMPALRACRASLPSRCPTRGHLDPRLLQYPSASGARSSAQYCLCFYSLWIVREARATLRPWRRCEARPVAANIGSRRAAPAPPARAAATS